MNDASKRLFASAHSLNVAMAVFPLLMTTLFDFAAPLGGRHETEYVPGLSVSRSDDDFPFEAPLTAKEQVPPRAMASSVPVPAPEEVGGEDGGGVVVRVVGATVLLPLLVGFGAGSGSFAATAAEGSGASGAAEADADAEGVADSTGAALAVSAGAACVAAGSAVATAGTSGAVGATEATAAACSTEEPGSSLFLLKTTRSTITGNTTAAIASAPNASLRFIDEPAASAGEGAWGTEAIPWICNALGNAGGGGIERGRAPPSAAGGLDAAGGCAL